MHVRSTTVLGSPQAVDDGISFLHEKVLPTIDEIDGCVGLSMLADRDTGRCIVSTAWITDLAMHSSAEQIRLIRARLVHILGAEDADEQEWEVAVVHRDRPAGDGAGAQVAWARIQPNHVDHLLDAYRHNLMPRLQELPGFCSVSMTVDRRNGRTASVTCFENREAFARVRKQARLLREQFAQAMAAKIVDVGEMELAVAHLRVPETV
jgi:heme-degrading monooxygenase HmoA